MKNSMKNLISPAYSRRMKNLSLRFTPLAWAKLLFLRDRGATEVGGFGISDPDDLLLVTDLALVDQLCSVASVEFADSAVADFFDQQVDGGLSPAQFARIWVHTHPGNSPMPSSVDEETFARVFGQSDWAVMFILAQHGQTSCRLQLNAGPTGAIEIPGLRRLQPAVCGERPCKLGSGVPGEGSSGSRRVVSQRSGGVRRQDALDRQSFRSQGRSR